MAHARDESKTKGDHRVHCMALVGHGPDVSALAIGVVLHRVPVGVAIATVIRERFGIWPALATIVSMALGTVFGALSAHAVSASAGELLAVVQALFVGVLLAAFMAPDTSVRAYIVSSASSRTAHVTGVLIGFGTTIALAAVHGEWATFLAFADLAAESAWPVLLAFVLVGVAQAMSRDMLRPLTGGGSLVRRAVVGTVVGLPTPLCSCSVLPMYAAARKQGVSAPAAMAFLVAAPEVGVPAIVLSASMLGGGLTAARVVGAAIIAVVVGTLVGRLAEKRAPSSATLAAPAATTPVPRIADVVRGALDAADHTGPWIVVGLVVAAVCAETLSALVLRGLPPGVDVLAATVVGLPLYVCASGSTPLATSLLAQGVSPGAVVAFLWAGPATNLTTVGLLTRLHGARVAAAFAATIGVSAVVLGLAFNAMGVGATVSSPSLDTSVGAFEVAGLIGLFALSVVSLWRQGARGALAQLSLSAEGDCPVHGPECRGHVSPLAVPQAALPPVGELTIRPSSRPRRGLAPPPSR